MRLTCYIAFALLFLLSCSKQEGNFVYFNSFESPKDINDFEGNAYSLSADVTRKAGDSCLVISGGCILPHAFFYIPVEHAMKIKVSALVKSKSGNCGQIFLSSLKTGEEIILSVKSKDWILSETIETLNVQDLDTIRVSFMAGGIFSCTNFIDNFTIEKVE
jgi:hypothetical protein